jgi:hypothetical protein
MIRRTLANVVLASMAASWPLGAQVRADPGTMINGRVAVRVYVTLSDNETMYAPIGGVNLRFFKTTADTMIVVRTDDAGTATAMLLPGEYRLMSTSPVDWKGARYSWNKLVTVREGIPTIELTSNTAVRDATVVVAPADSALSTHRPGVDGDRELIRRDPSMATMLSFFLPGAGQVYAGDRVKGAGLFVLAATGFGVAVNSLSCAASSDCESTTGKLTLGAAGMVAFFGSWIYGITDAGDSARRFNFRNGLAASFVQPLLAPGVRGQTRLGLSFAFPR